MFAMLLAGHTGAAQVPAQLVQSTVQAAMSLAGGKALVGGIIASSVRSLADSTVQSMAAARRKIVPLRLLILLALGLGLGLIAYGMGAPGSGYNSEPPPSETQNGSNPTGCHKP
jgi:hypothetical protein